MMNIEKITNEELVNLRNKYYNEEITVEMLFDEFKPLYDNVHFCSVGMIISLNKNLSDLILSILIKMCREDEFALVWEACQQIGKEELYWQFIVQNPHITEKFKLEHKHKIKKYDFVIGDKVHTWYISHGIIAGKACENKYFIINNDEEKQQGYNVDIVNVGCLVKGWLH